MITWIDFLRYRKSFILFLINSFHINNYPNFCMKFIWKNKKKMSLIYCSSLLVTVTNVNSWHIRYILVTTYMQLAITNVQWESPKRIMRHLFLDIMRCTKKAKNLICIKYILLKILNFSQNFETRNGGKICAFGKI